ncbi:CHAP domain containing protein [uncultured Caudovirales phage]|uniref:CHAP domain containing protein n=1 Tax=uncultured Caudovirales phage TaxID=2100421 RepID=A0A6J5T6G4_9CAUD|nr:CHAP domain containing protein [uncultured Caudovirales phage]
MTFPDGTIAKMVEVALGEVGYVEIPDNVTKYGAYTGANGKPWCGSFLDWCAHVAKLPVKPPSVVGTIWGSEQFKKLGRWHVTPKVGDFVFFDFIDDKKNVIQHVGLVVRIGKSNIRTVEGNTSDANQSNGGAVMLKTRKMGEGSFIVGYGRPEYNNSDVALPKVAF